MKNHRLTRVVHSSDYEMWTYLDCARFAVYRLRELELAPFGLTVEQYLFLKLLLNQGGSTTTNKMAELTMRQHHSISTLVSRMIKVNYVSRQTSPNGKGFEIIMTEEGRELCKKAPITSLGKIFSVLDVEEKKQLAHLLNSICEKSRDLLGLSYILPFIRQYFSNSEKGKSKNSKILSEEILSDYGMWTNLNRTSFAVYRLRELELAPFGLTVEQYSILKLLLNQGGSATTKKIEELTMRQHHSISTLVNRMIKVNYVSSQASLNGKSFEIIITEEGRELCKKVPAVSFEMAFSPLSIEERKQLVNLLVLVITKSRIILGYTTPFSQHQMG